MKTRAVFCVMLSVILFAFAGIVSQKAIADGGHNTVFQLPPVSFQALFRGLSRFAQIPAPSPRNHALRAACSSFPLSVLDNGAVTGDEQGNSYVTFTEVDSNLPVDASPPLVTPNEHTPE